MTAPTNPLSSATVTTLLRVAALLWVVWGIVHLAAGIGVMSSDTTTAVELIADGTDPALLAVDYPDAAGAIINQHGWNLAWGGLVTVIGAWFILRRSPVAIFVTAMVGGLLDVGYLLFIDLGGYNNFVPGTIMTFVSAAAIVISFLAYFRGLRGAPAERTVDPIPAP